MTESDTVGGLTVGGDVLGTTPDAALPSVTITGAGA